VRELLQSAELRLDPQRRRGLPSRDELARMAGALRHGDLIGVVMNESERATVDRVQAVMAVIEGHAEHVMDAVAPDLLPSLPRLRRALNARRRTQSRLSRLVGRLLGLDLKLRQYERGKQFCDAIVRQAGPGVLRHLFSAPEALPSLGELEDPSGWLHRTAVARGAA
jgi:putative hydrolase